MDLIYDHPEQPVAFEIASSFRHPVTGLQRFMGRFPRFEGRCYVVSPEPLGMLPGAAANRVGLLPLDLLLLVASRQEETALVQRLLS
ncbi:MAG: hypothetical protein J4G16_08210 [Acidobacteria bacterium]|nr:hypothetical protein [Acidobacteriota bacterium]